MPLYVFKEDWVFLCISGEQAKQNPWKLIRELPISANGPIYMALTALLRHLRGEIRASY